MSYQINMHISREGLRYIYDAGLMPTIVNNAAETPPDGAPVVAWAAFKPFQSNRIEWDDTYFMYATTTRLQQGAIIQISALTVDPVNRGWTYPFDGVFGSVPGTGENYTVVNQFPYRDSLAFGLLQPATVNGVPTKTPINAAAVDFNKRAVFAPRETVAIGLSEADRGGYVLGTIPEGSLIVRLTSQNPHIDVTFDDATHTFFLTGHTTWTQAEFAMGARPKDVAVMR